MRTFSLTNSQEDKLLEWLKKIEELHGTTGTIEYIFIPNGIAVSVFVKSSVVGKALDLSDYETW